MGTGWNDSDAAALLVAFRTGSPVFGVERIRAAASVNSRGGVGLRAFVRMDIGGVRPTDRDLGGDARSGVQVLRRERAVATDGHAVRAFRCGR